MPDQAFALVGGLDDVLTEVKDVFPVKIVLAPAARTRQAAMTAATLGQGTTRGMAALAPGAPREGCFEGLLTLADMSEEEL
ncbi:hypothetical protein Msi02_61040 [Microbispora siamensis]|uniref:Uncharacterized protein n=1 Tax=Microbispora siamensis TaxID=564413 RepID=A0ABQ4GV28_9ACTN|nr:hypothetical protein Msi02_61040 [Microbispora siamensis]